MICAPKAPPSPSVPYRLYQNAVATEFCEGIRDPLLLVQAETSWSNDGFQL